MRTISVRSDSSLSRVNPIEGLRTIGPCAVGGPDLNSVLCNQFLITATYATYASTTGARRKSSRNMARRKNSIGYLDDKFPERACMRINVGGNRRAVRFEP